jgi:serine/threonine protein kinase
MAPVTLGGDSEQPSDHDTTILRALALPAIKRRDLRDQLVKLESEEQNAQSTSLDASPTIPGYKILRLLGQGGMGVVYEAEQQSLGRHVALKVLPYQALPDRRDLDWFQREAKAAAQLHHTNIVPVYEVGEYAGVHYYAMQYIQGQSLDRVLEEVRRLRDAKSRPPAEARQHTLDLSISIAESLLSGRFKEAPSDSDTTSTANGVVPAPADTRLELASQTEAQYCRSVGRLGVEVAEALTYVHKQRILHRDIKPSNLLLDLQGTAWITDFGLAKAEGSDEQTSPGDIVGTLRFMAPERFQGKADPRSDVYSTGITLYEILTQRPAFSDSNRARLMECISCGQRIPPRKLDPHIPRDLEAIVLKAMAKEPTARYQTAKALAQDLQRFLNGEPIQARRVSQAERLWRWCQRKPWVAIPTAAAVLGLVSALVFGLGYLWQSGRAAQAQADQAKAEARACNPRSRGAGRPSERRREAGHRGRTAQSRGEGPGDVRVSRQHGSG